MNPTRDAGSVAGVLRVHSAPFIEAKASARRPQRPVQGEAIERVLLWTRRAITRFLIGAGINPLRLL